MNPTFTYTKPLENGQVRPKSYIASETLMAKKRSVFSNIFLKDVAIRIHFEPHLYIGRTGCPLRLLCWQSLARKLFLSKLWSMLHCHYCQNIMAEATTMIEESQETAEGN